MILFGDSSLFVWSRGHCLRLHTKRVAARIAEVSGEKVRFPDFPDKEQRTKNVWLDRLSSVVEEIPQNEEIIL